MRFYLDHASIAVPNLGEAVRWFDRVLGLRATVSPADPQHHSRIYLDRSYLEVSSRQPAVEWAVSLFFLRFEDPVALRRHLDAAGFTYNFGVYEGVDGRWDDVEIDEPSVPLPILVRRTHPPEIARNWPPPNRDPHPCGARRLYAVVVRVKDVADAVSVYGRLLGTQPESAAVGSDRAVLPLAMGRIVLVEGERQGTDGIVLEVPSLLETGRALAQIVRGAYPSLDPATTHGIGFGFVESR